MTEPRWITLRLAIDVHAAQLALFGGPAGIRDEGLLESALGRPLNKWAYGAEDMAELAAAYAFGIARNHPFVDGNKRAAFACMMLFLRRRRPPSWNSRPAGSTRRGSLRGFAAGSDGRDKPPPPT